MKRIFMFVGLWIMMSSMIRADVLLDNGIDEDGEDGSNNHTNTKRYARLEISPLQNDECKYCNILPICIGGCKQKILEKQNMKTCMFGFSESEKQEFANEYVIEKLTQE